LYEADHVFRWHGGILELEAEKLDAAFAGNIVLAHPLDHVQHFLGIKDEGVQPVQQLRWFADAGQHVVVNTGGLGHTGFHGKHGGTAILSQE
jgi:hypothetical protein